MVNVLVQEPPDLKGAEFLSELGEAENVNVTYSPVNLGCGGGRRVLVERTSTPLIMIIDDDVYLTPGWLDPVLGIFDRYEEIGAVGIPLYLPDGRVFIGYRLQINQRLRVVKRIRVDPSVIGSGREFVEVDDIAGAAMVFRRELKASITWDGRYLIGFDDIDKSLQILTADTRWRQVIALQSKVIHDKSIVDPKYDVVRWDYVERRASYRKFREKWGLRLPLVDHVKVEFIHPNPRLRRWTRKLKSAWQALAT